jgi:capsular polysaccharide biosynthesis protein
MGFLVGLVIGLAIAVVVHIYHNKIKAAVDGEVTELNSQITALKAKLPKI